MAVKRWDIPSMCIHMIWLTMSLITRFLSNIDVLLQVKLTREDIETILNTLIYDGKCERSIVASAGGSGDSGKVQLYRAINPLVETTGLMRMPCGSCPVSLGGMSIV